MHKKFEDARLRNKFAKLLNLVEEQEKDLKENPGPYIHRAYEEVSRARALVYNIRWALYDVQIEESMIFETMESTLNRRLRKIERLINEYEKN